MGALIVPNIPVFSYGNALQLDGVNDYVSFSNITLSTASSWTIKFMHKGTQGIGVFGNSATAGFIQLVADGRVIINNLFGLSVISFNNPARNTSTWYEYVITCTPTTLRCYVNSVESTSGGVSVVSVSGSINQIGRRQTGASYLSGTIDELAIWSGVALSGTQITSMYNGGAGDYAFNYSPSNLIAYWRMNGVSGDGIATDVNGTYNGTLNNFNTAACWVAH